MATKKQKLKNKWATIVLFFLFSIVLFINNLTDLFIKYNIQVQMSIVTWIGLIGTMFYTWWLASGDKL